MIINFKQTLANYDLQIGLQLMVWQEWGVNTHFGMLNQGRTCTVNGRALENVAEQREIRQNWLMAPWKQWVKWTVQLYKLLVRPYLEYRAQFWKNVIAEVIHQNVTWACES